MNQIEKHGIGVIMDNLTVLVGTCDKYSVLWKNFSKCYEKYFPYDVKTLFVGETIASSKYDTYLPGKSEGRPIWGKRIRDSLQFIQTDYLLFLLDDYFLHFDYTKDRLSQYVSDMDKYGMNRLQISRSSGQIYLGTNDTYLKFHPQSDYQFSLQPSIWRKDWIKVNCPDDFSPWDFEIKNNAKYMGVDTRTYLDPSINFPVYFNAVRSGFIKSDGWEEFRTREGLEDF